MEYKNTTNYRIQQKKRFTDTENKLVYQWGEGMEERKRQGKGIKRYKLVTSLGV